MIERCDELLKQRNELLEAQELQERQNELAAKQQWMKLMMGTGYSIAIRLSLLIGNQCQSHQRKAVRNERQSKGDCKINVVKISSRV